MSQVAGGMIQTGDYGDQLRNPSHNPTTGKTNQIYTHEFHNMAPIVDKTTAPPEGWGVVIIGYGDDESEHGDVPITCNGWMIIVPRQSRRALPRGHINVLMQSVETKFIQPHEGAPLKAYPHYRYPFQILKMPEGRHGGHAFNDSQMSAIEKAEIDMDKPMRGKKK